MLSYKAVWAGMGDLESAVNALAARGWRVVPGTLAEITVGARGYVVLMERGVPVYTDDDYKGTG